MVEITECKRCRTMFRDGPEVCGVCPKCGHENDFDDDHIPASIGDHRTTYADMEHTDLDGPIAGDCWRACVANLFDLSGTEVPHFVEEHGDYWLQETQKWLSRYVGPVLLMQNAEFPTVQSKVILVGRSPRGDHAHAVLADRDGNILHDPHPSRDGLRTRDYMFVVMS